MMHSMVYASTHQKYSNLKVAWRLSIIVSLVYAVVAVAFMLRAEHHTAVSLFGPLLIVGVFSLLTSYLHRRMVYWGAKLDELAEMAGLKDFWETP